MEHLQPRIEEFFGYCFRLQVVVSSAWRSCQRRECCPNRGDLIARYIHPIHINGDWCRGCITLIGDCLYACRFALVDGMGKALLKPKSL
jgi:hypothetical protein